MTKNKKKLEHNDYQTIMGRFNKVANKDKDDKKITLEEFIEGMTPKLNIMDVE